MIDVLKSLIKQFMPFAQEKMGFSRPPKLFLRQDDQNAANPLGKTGFYDPEKESITLYTTGRHPKDIMRSLAHELQHHTQKCNGEFENTQNMGEEGYAQSDPHMRTMEIQAYQASIVFRDWEDSCKGTIYYEHLQKGDNVSMSTKNWKNQELKSLLSEAWGFKMDLSKLNESGAPPKAEEERRRQEEEEQAELGELPLPKPEDKPKDKPEEALEEMGCGGDDQEMVVSMGGVDTTGMEMAGGENEASGMEMPEEAGIQALAAKAMEAIQALADAAGAGEQGLSDEEPDLTERRGRGRDREAMAPDERRRPMAESKVRAQVLKALKEMTKGK
jgi:hypothetical protein